MAAFPTNTEPAPALRPRSARAGTARGRRRRPSRRRASLGARDAATHRPARRTPTSRRAGRTPPAAVLAAGIEANPSDAALRQDLGRLLLAEGRADEALPVLEEAARLSPDDGRDPARPRARPRERRAARGGRGGVSPRHRAGPERPPLPLRPRASAPARGQDRARRSASSASTTPSTSGAGRPSRRYDVKNSEIAYAWAELHKGNARRRAGAFRGAARDARDPARPRPRPFAPRAPRGGRRDPRARAGAGPGRPPHRAAPRDRARERRGDPIDPRSCSPPWPPRRRDPATAPSGSRTSPRRRASGSPTTGARRPSTACPRSMGSGLAWLDYDNDGWMDLYVVQGGPVPARRRRRRPRDRLYRNNGDGTFTDVTEKAGLNDTRLRDGGDRRRLRQRRVRGPLRHQLRRQHPVPQRRERDVHRRDGEGGRWPARASARARRGRTSTATATSTSSSPSTPTTARTRTSSAAIARRASATTARRIMYDGTLGVALSQRRRTGRSPTSPGRRASARPSARASASSSSTSTSTGSPTSTSPTTR